VDGATIQSRAPVVGVARHFIKTFCSSYTGIIAKLPMKSVEGRICQEEQGYRGFKRRREFLQSAGRQDKGRPAAFQAEDRGVRLSLPAPK